MNPILASGRFFLAFARLNRYTCTACNNNPTSRVPTRGLQTSRCFRRTTRADQRVSRNKRDRALNPDDHAINALSRGSSDQSLSKIRSSYLDQLSLDVGKSEDSLGSRNIGQSLDRTSVESADSAIGNPKMNLAISTAASSSNQLLSNFRKLELKDGSGHEATDSDGNPIGTPTIDPVASTTASSLDQPSLHISRYPKMAAAQDAGYSMRRVVIDPPTGPPPGSKSPITISDHSQNISQSLRSVMRHSANPIAIVTTLAGAPKSIPDEDPADLQRYHALRREYSIFRGATISSLVSVTMGPPAYISFNMKAPSATLTGIFRNRRFRIHLPRATRMGERIARAFVAQGPPATVKADIDPANPFVKLAKMGVGIKSISKNYRDFIIDPVAGHIRASLLCRTRTSWCVGVGDHFVVVAQVLKVDNTEDIALESPDNTRVKHRADNLLYYDGRYARVDTKPITKLITRISAAKSSIRKQDIKTPSEVMWDFLDEDLDLEDEMPDQK